MITPDTKHYSFSLVTNQHLCRRLIARVFDLMFVLSIHVILSEIFAANLTPPIFLYVLYNVLVIITGGKTLGKYLLYLDVITKNSGLKRTANLLAREFSFYLFFPIIVFSIILFSNSFIHDRACSTLVIKHK